MKKILVVNINWLGDAIFSTPVFMALKRAYPQATVVCLCPPRVRDVMEHCPYVDRVMLIDEQKKHRWPWQKVKLVARLHQEHFDAAVILHRSFTRALIVALAGIPRRIGYNKAAWLLTDPVKPPDAPWHRAKVYLNALKPLGIAVSQENCPLRLHEADLARVESLMRERALIEGKFVLLHPGGNWDLKRWPVDCWVSLAREIHTRWTIPVVLLGGKEEEVLCQQIATKAGAGAVVLAGQTTLGESLVLFKKAARVISADSGPLHLAHSVGAQVIGLFGPTQAQITGPWGQGHVEILRHDVGCNKAPCYHLHCQDNVCMKSITVDEVLKTMSSTSCGFKESR